jgi:KDO2-lipid IV(A) lauroyltransferase
VKLLFLRGVFRFFSLLPWPVINLLATGIAGLLEFMIKYRKSVIHYNLQRCFPNWELSYRKKVINKFYLHFVDIFLEVFKSNSWSSSKMLTHFTILNDENMQELLNDPRHQIILFGHFHNWEWITQACGAFFCKTHQQNMIGFFKHMQDKTVEKFMNEYRTRLGGEMYSDRQPRTVLKLLFGKNKLILGTVADQTPPGREDMFWVDFLNTPTPFFKGPGFLAAASKSPVWYGHITQVKRHHYEMKVIPVWEPTVNLNNSADENASIITKQYASLLEQQIQQEPWAWLWSHRRWKYAPLENEG